MNVCFVLLLFVCLSVYAYDFKVQVQGLLQKCPGSGQALPGYPITAQHFMLSRCNERASDVAAQQTKNQKPIPRLSKGPGDRVTQ